MGLSVFPAASSGMTTTRFPAAIGNAFNIPSGLTLQNTITSTTTVSSLPAQVWVVLMGGGGGGGAANNEGGGGGGGGACIGWVDVPTSGSLTFTIGAGGTGGAFNNSGNTGGNTSVGGLIAYGGCGGIGSTSTQPWNSARHQTFYGPGAGLGGWTVGLSFNGGTGGYQFPWKQNAPFFLDISSGISASIGYIGGVSAASCVNYTGGGAGGNGYVNTGGNGLSAGGGKGGSSGSTGGNSSRNAGITNTFTGGSAGGSGGGGGAGLLANGGTGSSATAGTGGSGGGGGGGNGYDGSTIGTGGTGGAGCALIYYQEI